MKMVDSSKMLELVENQKKFLGRSPWRVSRAALVGRALLRFGIKMMEAESEVTLFPLPCSYADALCHITLSLTD